MKGCDILVMSENIQHQEVIVSDFIKIAGMSVYVFLVKSVNIQHQRLGILDNIKKEIMKEYNVYVVSANIWQL